LLIPQAGGVSSELIALYVRSLGLYDTFVDEVREATGAVVELRRCGHLVLALDDARADIFGKHVASQRAAGLRAEFVSAEDARRLEPAITPEVRAAVLFPEHGLVDNHRLAVAVSAAAERAGAQVRPDEPALSLAIDGGRIEGVKTARGPLGAAVVVNAAGCWSSTLTPWRGGIVGPAKGEMIALRTLSKPVERIISIPGGSVSARGDGRVLVGATRIDGHYSKTVSAEAVSRMLSVATRAVPSLAGASFDRAWAGLRPRSADEQPVIGPDEVDGLYWATGHLGMGILSAPATADILVDLIEGRAPTLSIESFRPTRFPAREPQALNG
jgi:glycine oxidase